MIVTRFVSALVLVAALTSLTASWAEEDTSLDDLLAQLDAVERASEIALTSRKHADQLALSDSLQSGGAGTEIGPTTQSKSKTPSKTLRKTQDQSPSWSQRLEMAGW